MPGQDPTLMLLDKMDQIIDLLRIQVGLQPATARITQESRGIQTPVELMKRQNLLSELMLAAVLPSAPALTETYRVTPSEVCIASNESIPLMRVEVTNDNVAQPCWVSKKGVLTTSGRRIRAQETVPFVLPNGSQLYAVCAIPWISVRVSIAYDFYAILDQIRSRAR